MDFIAFATDGWRIAWPGALEAMARRYDPVDLLKALPRSFSERHQIRAAYQAERGPVPEHREEVCLRAIDRVIGGILSDPIHRARPAEYCEPTTRALPTSRAACDWEILSLFAHPDYGIRRVVRDTLPTRALFGFDVVRAVEREWCITAVPRPEVLAIDYDGVPVAQIEAIDDALAAEGIPTLWYPSGRGIRAIVDAQGDLRQAEAHSALGFHALSIMPDAATKERWQRTLGQPSIAIRSGQQIRPPLGTYKVKERKAPEWVQRYRSRLADASEKRLFRRACRRIEPLQEVVAFLRTAPRWSGVPSFEVRAAYPGLHDHAAWAVLRREAEAAHGWRAAEAHAAHSERLVGVRYAIAISHGSTVGGISRELPRATGHPSSHGHATGVLASATRGRRRSADRECLTLLEQGDVDGRFMLADGTGTDRSRMSFTVLLWLARRGASRAEVDRLVAAQRPGLAAYSDRKKRRRLEHDWPKAVASVQHERWYERERVLAHALTTIEKWRDVHVLLALMSLGSRPAPGFRRLGELTGYSVRTVWKSARRLEGRYIVKQGRVRGPGDRLAQRWQFVMPPYDDRAWPRVNTCEVTPKACRKLLDVAAKMRRAGISLLAGMRVDLRGNGKRLRRVPRLTSMSLERRRQARAAVRCARLRNEADRARYAQRLERAEEAGVPFLPPREARQEKCRRFRRRLEKLSLTEGEFFATLKRARRSLPPELYRTLQEIPSPNNRWRAIAEEFKRERLRSKSRFARVLALVA